MDQISTLKWIAENGNPVGSGSDAEKAYLQYKSDPTFRKLAIDIAENGNPVGRGDVEKEYIQYKDTLGVSNPTPTVTPKLTNEQYKLLQQNVGNYGYSGLDDVQKKQFQEQFPDSKFAKAGGSFEDAVKYVDSQSAYNKEGNPNTGMNTSEMGDNTTLSGALKNTWMGIKDIGTLVKEHPGTAAFTLASGMFPEMLPLTAGGVMRAGVAGSAATALDKAHPFTSEMPDYKTETPIESATDILGSGAGAALTHGLLAGANRAIGARYYGALKANTEAEAVAAEQNAKIAEENARRATFNEHVEHQSMLDPKTKLHFYRNEMMRQNPEVTESFKPKFESGNDLMDALMDALNEYNYYKPTREELLKQQLNEAVIAAANVRRAKQGLPPLPKPEKLPEAPLIAKGIAEPSDWDVAKFKNEYETVIPEVAPKLTKVPTVDFTEWVPNSFRSIEGKVSNLIRGENAGKEAWYSLTNNPEIYPMLEPATSALARGLDPFAQYIIPKGIDMFRKPKDKDKKK